MIDQKIGLQYMDIVCDKCKIKVLAKMKRVSKFALLNPLGLAKSFQSIICKDCRTKILKRMREVKRNETK